VLKSGNISRTLTSITNSGRPASSSELRQSLSSLPIGCRFNFAVEVGPIFLEVSAESRKRYGGYFYILAFGKFLRDPIGPLADNAGFALAQIARDWKEVDFFTGIDCLRQMHDGLIIEVLDVDRISERRAARLPHAGGEILEGLMHAER